MRNYIIATGVAIAMLGIAGAAGASISHVFGHGGKHYVFDAACHRVTFVPPGISDHEGLNVTAQQTHCLVRRPTFAACVRHLGPAPTVKLVRKDDWTNVDKVAAYQQAIYNCSIGTF